MSAGRSRWADLHILDRQILDRDGRPVAKVDDLEFDLPAERDSSSLPTVTRLLCGPAALGRRFGPNVGNLFEALRGLLRDAPSPAPAGIPIDEVVDFGPAIKLSVCRDDLGDVNAVENFLGEHVIGHIPGAGKPDDTANENESS